MSIQKARSSPQSRSGDGGQGRAADGPHSERLMEYVSIGQVKPNPANPRTHSKTQLKKLQRSMKRFGFVAPMIVDAAGVLLAGHARLEVARMIGLDKVPVIRASDLTPAEAKAYLIADNQLVLLGDWDSEALGALMLELSLPSLNIDLEDTGFEMSQIDLLIDAIGKAPQPSGKEDELPVPRTPVTVLGDAWLTENGHIIVCGDSTRDESFAAFGGKKADMACIDPPYNVRIPGHVSGNGKVKHQDFAMASGEMSRSEYIDFLVAAFRQLAAHTRAGAIIDVFEDWRHLSELYTAGERALFVLLTLAVWVKENAGMGSMYRSQHELCAVFRNGRAPHRNNVQLGKFGRYRTNVWKYPSAKTFSRSGDEGNILAMHPTPKSVALIQDAILDCTARGDIVLDSFLGSGTLLISAERSGRICHGVELEPGFVDVAVRRWQAYTGGQARHAVTGKTFDEMAKERAKPTSKGIRKGGRHG